MTVYRDRLLAGLYDPDEEVREKAAIKLDKQQQAVIREAQKQDEVAPTQSVAPAK